VPDRQHNKYLYKSNVNNQYNVNIPNQNMNQSHMHMMQIQNPNQQPYIQGSNMQPNTLSRSLVLNGNKIIQ
jgi:hypothetical protein